MTETKDKLVTAESLKYVHDTLSEKITEKIGADELETEVENALTKAKESGEFDGTPGKTAYSYAQDGGYAGTETEFASKLAWLMALEDGNGVLY